MNKVRIILKLFLLLAIFTLAGCGPDDEPETGQEPAQETVQEPVQEAGQVPATPEETAASETANGQAPSAAGDQDIDELLQQINDGQLTNEPSGSRFDWGLGYLLYYGPVESLGVDNLIYNALLVQNRLDTGEATASGLDQNGQNLLDLTEGIEFDPDVEPTEQVAQTPEVRQAILDRIVDSQAGLSPEQALESTEVIGVYAPPAPDSVGAKYLVYTQESPEAPLEFLGVVIAVDATATDSASVETYSFQGWQDLPWLGDAAGPFWDDLPAGVSGDPTSTDEGRPGVLFISEDTFAQVEAGNFELD